MDVRRQNAEGTLRGIHAGLNALDANGKIPIDGQNAVYARAQVTATAAVAQAILDLADAIRETRPAHAAQQPGRRP